ncbi:MAG: DUF5696 domain-containing protein [Eubacteriales bacterium]|nr:DUF5696 domain-containing protein [Eubacteriales bacterium]
MDAISFAQAINEALYAMVSYRDGTQTRMPLECIESPDGIIASFPEIPDWSQIRAIDFAPELGCASAGDAGYYVLPHGQNGTGDSILCKFRQRPNAERVASELVMPIWGVIQPQYSFTAIVSSMTYEYQLVTSVKDGIYHCYARFTLDGEAPYEPIIIEYRTLPSNADYNDVALAYRKWREQRGEIHLYANRAKGRPAAQYTADSVYVRIRQAWKPVPPLVREQTPENEPPMHVAATFEDVSQLLDVFRAKGIDKAELCLVGWNKSGHDGRWPQIFPVEEKLGGEAALRALTAKASAMGYAMVCHTNSTDAYSIADCWKDTELIHDRDGNKMKNETAWSGGDMYWVCPLCGFRQAQELLPKVRELGFQGSHYIDVISTIYPRACHDPAHPVTRRQTVALWNRIFRLARQEFGGISSEGAYDFSVPELDFGLYVCFGLKDPTFADECIPLWQLVYHGYTLSNPYTKTVNPTQTDLLKVLEYGGRPTFYYDSKFVTPEEGKEVNWMGEDDFHCHTAEERESSAAYIARVSKWYKEISYLQTVPMKRHDIMPDGRRRVLYENGDEVLVDYVKQTAHLNGKQILPLL